MVKGTFFNISQTITIAGCAFLVVFITSLIHHRVGKITRWWDPRWASFVFSMIIGVVVQLQFIEVIEPVHLFSILSNTCLIYLSAVGFNAVVGKPVQVLGELGEVKSKGKKEEKEPAVIISSEETWRTRWFD